MAGYRPTPPLIVRIANLRNQARADLNRAISERTQARQDAYDAGNNRTPSREELDAELDALAPLADRYARLEAMAQAISAGEWHAAA